METSHPYPIGPGARVLAAIVFTDVVSFSERIREMEVPTLKLLEQDFAFMKEQCERYTGSVLKTTGDGLLLYFSSATQAVKFSLKVQRVFAERAKTSTDEEVLTHRIGVHLGDVFASDQDVMGDGVNVASRLQAMADPGGVCISQTVYDVVKDKLELDVERISPREGKNFAKLGQLYRVLLEPRKANPAAAEYRPQEILPRSILSPTEKLVFGVLLVAVLGGVSYWAFLSHSEQKQDLASSSATRDAIDVLLAGKQTAGGGSAVPPSGTASAQAAPPDFVALTLNADAEKKLTKEQLDAVRTDGTSAVATLLTWVNQALSRKTESQPLSVTRLEPASGTETKVYPATGGRIVFALGGAAKTARLWEELSISEQEALIVSLLRNSLVPPPADVLRGADAFAYLNHRPEMARALHPSGR